LGAIFFLFNIYNNHHTFTAIITRYRFGTFKKREIRFSLPVDMHNNVSEADNNLTDLNMADNKPASRPKKKKKKSKKDD